MIAQRDVGSNNAAAHAMSNGARCHASTLSPFPWWSSTRLDRETHAGSVRHFVRGAFNLETLRNCLSLSGEIERRTECRKVQIRHFPIEPSGKR